MSLKRENKGQLWFYDSGKEFLGEKHALTNLIRENDICVYSLTPKGEKQPKYLIVKVTQAGAMQKQFDGTATGVERCVAAEMMEYEKAHPMNLFSITDALKGTVAYTFKHHREQQDFFRPNGNFTTRLTPQEFFSIEVDPDSVDHGAQIYLRDKAHFLCISK